LLEFENEAAIRELKPDFTKLARCRGAVIVTSVADEGAFDFVSRFFAPAAGIDEDPVTGSAHCALGAVLARAAEQGKLPPHTRHPRAAA